MEEIGPSCLFAYTRESKWNSDTTPKRARSQPDAGPSLTRQRKVYAPMRTPEPPAPAVEPDARRQLAIFRWKELRASGSTTRTDPSTDRSRGRAKDTSSWKNSPKEESEKGSSAEPEKHKKFRKSRGAQVSNQSYPNRGQAPRGSTRMAAIAVP